MNIRTCITLYKISLKGWCMRFHLTKFRKTVGTYKNSNLIFEFGQPYDNIVLPSSVKSHLKKKNLKNVDYM